MTDSDLKRKSSLIQEILQVCVANGIRADGNLFFSLAFMSESNLKKICRDLHIEI